MGKIIKFPSLKKPLEVQREGLYFVEYRPSKNCCNRESYGQICLKCERCGRRFEDGWLQKEGDE